MPEFTFVGRGRKNAVFAISADCFEELACVGEAERSTVARVFHGHDSLCLRVSAGVQRECAECVAALHQYTGPRLPSPLPISDALRSALSRAAASAAGPAVPSEVHELLSVAQEALVLPDWRARPSSYPAEVTCTVELKPKSVWRRPSVVGIAVGSDLHFMHSSKSFCCRFSQMRCYDRATGRCDAAAEGYCPNLIFPQSTQEDGNSETVAAALRCLVGSRYLKLTSATAPSTSSSESDDPPVSNVAQALVQSDMLRLLAHLQLRGIAAVEGNADEPMTLDIELLYRWTAAVETARDSGTSSSVQPVRWIVDRRVPADSAADLQCGCRCSCRTLRQRVSREECVRNRWRSDPGAVGSDFALVEPALPLRDAIHRFYTATTARDVSLLVTVPRKDKSLSDAAKLGVVDLDDKSHKPLEWYLRRDRAITSAWESELRDETDVGGSR